MRVGRWPGEGGEVAWLAESRAAKGGPGMESTSSAGAGITRWIIRGSQDLG